MTLEHPLGDPPAPFLFQEEEHMIKITCPCGFSLEAENVDTDWIDKLWAEHKHTSASLPPKYGTTEFWKEFHAVCEELKTGRNT